jgi:hypothetical protein
MNLTELAGKLAPYAVVHLDTLDIDVRIKCLSLGELQEVERLTEACSLGSGANRKVNDLPKLVHTLVKRYFTDAEGQPLAGEDDVKAAKDWPGVLVTELMKSFQKVNAPEDKPDPN